MNRILSLSVLLAAAGCASTPYDNPSSIVTTETMKSSDFLLKPVFVNRVDGEHSPYGNLHVIPPGPHTIQVDLAPRGGFHEPTQKSFALRTEPCVRYNVAAKLENSISQQWTPVVRSTEPIGECRAKFRIAG